jgi:hypothetical protein
VTRASASKAVVAGYTRYLAVALGPHMRAKRGRAVQRFAKPDAIAQVVVFLLLPSVAYVNVPVHRGTRRRICDRPE